MNCEQAFQAAHLKDGEDYYTGSHEGKKMKDPRTALLAPAYRRLTRGTGAGNTTETKKSAVSQRQVFIE